MYITQRFYIILTALILLIGSGYWFSPMFNIGRALLALFTVAVVADAALLWHKRGITASRRCADRFSNGDNNRVLIDLGSSYHFSPKLTVTDEIPHQFQQRNICFKAQPNSTLTYELRPTQRGVFAFGHIRVFARSPLALLERRFTCGEPKEVKVYPSYLMLHQYELLAFSNRLNEMGIKRIRRIGNNTDFEQIKDYVQGDDYRTINWRATARRSHLMVNVYQDEKSQQVFNIIDKGRVMQQAFHNLSLLDYAINAALVLSYVAMHKDDKAGLGTFCNTLDSFLTAQKSPGHMQNILETLYNVNTDFGESDFSALVDGIRLHITKRSLIILYTNFSGEVSMRRQLPYLKQLARHHRVLVVFFADAELKDYAEQPAKTSEDYYRHVIAEKFIYEQRLVVNTLKQNGILCLLTTPDQLSVNVINKYLELKARGMVN